MLSRIIFRNKKSINPNKVRNFSQLVNWETSQPVKDQSLVDESKYIIGFNINKCYN